MPQPNKKLANNTTEDVTATLTTKDRFTAWQQKAVIRHWRFAIAVACSAIAAGGVALDVGLVNLLERQTQSLFFELRGPIAAPEDIVILTIDEDSLSQGQYYSEDSIRNAALQPIESWPWQRRAYGQVITRLMEAGAKTVALDILFSTPSTYGPADDEAFAEVLKRYGDRIVLAADYDDIKIRQGTLSQPDLPIDEFQAAGVRLGSVNFRREPNLKIHRLGQEFLAERAQADASIPDASTLTLDDEAELLPLSFAQATLAAARTAYDMASKENIFFFGPVGTFEHVPFWYVLDDDPWQNQLARGRFFKDKIVIIGNTATVLQDFHKAPFSESLLYQQSMPGVEVLANTVATLRDDLSPKQLIERPELNALLVLALGLSVSVLIRRNQKPLNRALVAGGGLGLWSLTSYGAFVGARTVLILSLIHI